jgi:hypothetical protein
MVRVRLSREQSVPQPVLESILTAESSQEWSLHGLVYEGHQE